MAHLWDYYIYLHLADSYGKCWYQYIYIYIYVIQVLQLLQIVSYFYVESLRVFFCACESNMLTTPSHTLLPQLMSSGKFCGFASEQMYAPTQESGQL